MRKNMNKKNSFFLWLKNQFQTLIREIKIIAFMTWRNLQVDYAYKFQLFVDLSWIAIDIAIFSIWGGLIGEAGGDTGLNATTYLLVTVAFWVWLGKAYDDTIIALQEETSRGTIGYLVTNNVSITIILISRFIATTVKTTIITFFVIIPLFWITGVVKITNLGISIIIIVVLTFIISWGFMIAFSTLVASLNIIFKKIGALGGMMLAALKVASGYYFPLSRFQGENTPSFIRFLIKICFLLPTTQGAEITRRVLGGGYYSTTQLIGLLTGLSVGTIIMLLVSILVVKKLTDKSRYWGTLEQY